jgi:extracellular elastinolytic metalloproteinase
LRTRNILIPNNAVLSFWQTYQLESGRDGAVIEISTDNGVTFTDLGSLITTGKYNGTISTRYNNPIGGRSAWTGGTLGTWSQVVVDLSSYAGDGVILRFRLATDNRRSGLGWYIDDVIVSGP